MKEVVDGVLYHAMNNSMYISVDISEQYYIVFHIQIVITT